jgi:acyl-lipid omega-3 desaturase
VLQKTDLSAKPPFTLSDLRAAIPDECWEKNAVKSFTYLIKDVAIVFALAAGAMAINSWCVPRLTSCQPSPTR